jgi:hypothetical protein
VLVVRAAEVEREERVEMVRTDVLRTTLQFNSLDRKLRFDLSCNLSLGWSSPYSSWMPPVGVRGTTSSAMDANQQQAVKVRTGGDGKLALSAFP